MFASRRSFDPASYARFQTQRRQNRSTGKSIQPPQFAQARSTSSGYQSSIPRNTLATQSRRASSSSSHPSPTPKRTRTATSSATHECYLCVSDIPGGNARYQCQECELSLCSGCGINAAAIHPEHTFKVVALSQIEIGNGHLGATPQGQLFPESKAQDQVSGRQKDHQHFVEGIGEREVAEEEDVKESSLWTVISNRDPLEELSDELDTQSESGGDADTGVCFVCKGDPRGLRHECLDCAAVFCSNCHPLHPPQHTVQPVRRRRRKSQSREASVDPNKTPGGRHGSVFDQDGQGAGFWVEAYGSDGDVGDDGDDLSTDSTCLDNAWGETEPQDASPMTTTEAHYESLSRFTVTFSTRQFSQFLQTDLAKTMIGIAEQVVGEQRRGGSPRLRAMKLKARKPASVRGQRNSNRDRRGGNLAVDDSHDGDDDELQVCGLLNFDHKDDAHVTKNMERARRVESSTGKRLWLPVDKKKLQGMKDKGWGNQQIANVMNRTTQAVYMQWRKQTQAGCSH